MIDSSIILAIAAGKAKPEDVSKYAANLESFVQDVKNKVRPDYYEAQHHLSQCYDYLTQCEHLDKNAVDDKSKNSFRQRLQIPLEELEQELRNLSYQNLKDDKLEGALLYLADRAGTTAYNLKKYYESIKTSEDREEFLSSTKSELDLILKLEATKLDLNQFLPTQLARETLNFASKLKVSPECCLTALITAISTCCKIGTQLEINPGQGFIVSPYQFSMIVAESGSMKSAIYDTFAKDPLAAIQASILQGWKEEKKQQEAMLEEYLAMDLDNRKLEYPEGIPQVSEQPRALHFGSKTMEGILYQFELYPDQPIAYMKDELAGLFMDADKYNAGKGSESKDLMSMHGGTAPPVLRRHGGLVSNPGKVGLNIFGTIQPEVLQEFWSSVTDPDGYWSRFLYCYQAKSQKEIEMSRSASDNALPGMLESLFRSIYTLPPISYKLCDYGYEIYATYYNYLGKKGYEEVHPAMSKAYSKALGITGRLILMLHIIDEISTGKDLVPCETVNYRTVIKGIDLMSFYLKQRDLLMKKLCNQESISPQLKAIVDVSKRVGWITARVVKQNVWQLKNEDSNTIRSWFQELVDLGYGEIQGKGKKLKFAANFSNPLQFDPKNR